MRLAAIVRTISDSDRFDHGGLFRGGGFIIGSGLLAECSMKFAIAVFSAAHAPSSRRALLFAQAALAGGHEIVRLFFYQDGVYLSLIHI